MTLYSIEIRRKAKNTGRFIEWNDPKGFYGALPFPCYRFTKEEALAIAKDLESKYVYAVTLKGTDKTEEVISNSAFDKPVIVTAKVTAIKPIQAPKKGLSFCFGKK